MILHHGTNVVFDKIDLSKSLPYKDFGSGFYLTDILEQAERIASRKSRRFGRAIVYSYEVDDGIAYILSRYEEGTMPLKEALEELKFAHLTSQYCFCTQTAISHLKKITL